jgi:hypothetical protein
LYKGKLVFAQLMEYLTIHIFRQIVKPYAGDRKVQTSSYRNQLIPEAGTFYGMDRGYLDFTRLNQFHQSVDFFVIRGKSNLKIQR